MSQWTEPSDECIFCRIATGTDEQEFVALRDKHTVVFPSLLQSQDNLGHCIVIPVEHYRGHLHPAEQRAAGPERTPATTERGDAGPLAPRL